MSSSFDASLKVEHFPVHSASRKSLGLVIGAGSTGLISAAQLSKNHDLVRIFEASTDFGGVTREFSGTDGRQFYAGCHYLHSDYLPTGYDYSLLNSFEHRYGSLTDVEGNWIYKDNFAGPAFPDSWIELHGSDEASEPDWELLSLRDRILLYQAPVQKALFSFLERFLPASRFDSLPAESASVFGISRVTSHQYEENLVHQKRNSPLYDNLFGASRSLLGLRFERAAVPRLGFSHFWSEFLRQVQGNVQVELHRRARINRPTAFADLESFGADSKLWTADPRFPVRHFSDSRLDSMTHKKYFTGVHLNEFAGPLVPHYLNFFSAHKKLTRAYFYELDGELRATFESSQPFQDLKELISEVVPALQVANILLGLPSQEITSRDASQYFPMTRHDANLVEFATRKMMSQGWLDSGMGLFDRKSRMERIERSLGMSANVSNSGHKEHSQSQTGPTHEYPSRVLWSLNGEL